MDSRKAELEARTGTKKARSEPRIKVLCPFKAHYPENPDFEGCQSHEWGTLVEHLVRQTHRPRNQCQKCGRDFYNVVEYEKHTTTCDVVPTRVFESPFYVGREKVEPIRSLTRKGRQSQPIEDLYSELWLILFGDGPPVPDRTVWLHQSQKILEDLGTDNRLQDARAGKAWADTNPTRVSNAADVADINHPPTNNSDNDSVTSGMDQFYSQTSTVLGNKLARDLQDVDLTRLEDMLATRLEEFSLRFGNEHASANHLRTMSKVYRRSRRIAARVCRGAYKGDTEDSNSISDESSSDDSKAVTAVTQWLGDIQGSADTTYDETANDDNNEEELVPGYKTLFDSEAYRWLVSVMQRTSRLNGIDPHCMIHHREIMTRQLQAVTDQQAQKPKSHRLITSKNQPPLFLARFDLEWDPVTFLQEECEGKNQEEVAGQVLALTGDERSVQAETCRGYLEQVWPTTGSEFMNLVEDLVTRAGQNCRRVLPDRTEISARLHDETCVIEALGTQSSLSDVAEQLLWISTTLRMPSGAATGMTLCSAELVPTTTTDDEAILIEQTYHQRCLGKVDFRVVYKTNPLPKGLAEGDCWMELFPSCPVTIGYPIPSRKPQRPGLELPLDIMVSLVGADRVTPFGHDLIIKGYSDLFYATDHTDGCVMWHLICNKRDPVSGTSRISFADRRIPRPTEQTPSLLRPGDVLEMRHIIGWTTTIKSNAGAPDAEYGSITSSNLGTPPQDWALDRVQITAGQYVTISGGFVRCKRQKPIVNKEENYIRKLRDIGRNRFLLCDVDSHKVWMVNGLSVLLHLVRSHLVDAENDKFYETGFAVKADELKAVGGPSGSKAAFETLRCDSNRVLLLYHKDASSHTGSTEKEIRDIDCLEDLVRSIMHILEQIVDHQNDLRYEEASVGYRIKRAPWERLEGFDFMDVATLRHTISPRFTSLRAEAKGWAQLTRTLEAPTLFAKKFGEMLEPGRTDENSTKCSVCHWNDTMPPERDLLAARVEDLLDAGEKDADSYCLRFTNELCLDIPPVLFKPCTTRCQDNDRIQKLQQTSENKQSSSSVWEKALRCMKLFDRETKNRNDEIQSSSPTRIPPDGAVLLGMPQKSSEPDSQTTRRYTNRTADHSVQPLAYIDDLGGAASSSQVNNATANDLDPASELARTESMPLPTHLASPHLLSNSVANPCSPESSVSACLRPPQDDFHRSKRAERRAKEGKYHCQM